MALKINKVLNEQNNHYPFGLQHGSYNTPARDYRPIGDAREVEMVDRNPYKYKYQGQELQDELGLGWYQYKYRMYNPAIGRFHVPDILSEQYSGQGHYNFSENTPVMGIELEGLEYYFSADGRLLGREHANNNILVQSSVDATAVNSKTFSTADELKYSSFVPWASAPPEARNEVAKAIYLREIGGKINSMTSKGNASNVGASISAVGEFNVNPWNSNNGELLNNDYYNMSANLQHEENHNVDLQNGVDTDQNKNNSWRHFEVHINSIIDNKSDFDKTTEAYKDFSQGAARVYLNRMTSFITDRLPNMNSEEFKSNENIQNAIKFLEKSIKTYNSIFGQNMQMVDFDKLNQEMYDDRTK